MRVGYVVAGFFLLVAAMGAANLVASSSYLCSDFATESNGISSGYGACSSSELGWANAVAGAGVVIGGALAWMGVRPRRTPASGSTPA